MFLSNVAKTALKSNGTRRLLESFSNNSKTCCASTAVLKENQEAEEDKLYKFVEMEMRGNDPAVLKSFSQFATTAAGHFDIESKSWTLRKPNHERFTVLKSVHIYKKHLVQYEVRTYYNFVQFKHLTGSTADTLIEYIQRNLPEGVALKTTKVELQQIPDHLTPPTATTNTSPPSEVNNTPS